MTLVKRFLPGVATAATAFLMLAPGCGSKEPRSSTYFERTISPILTTSCVRTNTGAGCHVADFKGNALGNLDVSTYDNVRKRRDLLLDYGAYGQPAFLLKNVEAQQVDIQTYDGERVVLTTDIKHAGGSVLDPGGSAYQTLRRWIQNGATENNSGQPPPDTERQPCNTFVPSRADFDLSADPPRGDFAVFRDKVNEVITGGTASCAAANCHGTIANSLYLTCGATPEQLRWNYLSTQEYLAQTPERSELLRRPLAPSQGGAYHEGGVIFGATSDEGYRALDEWARAHGPPVLPPVDDAFTFFSRKVQPILVKKGCMMIQCHSSGMFHDYRLHGGSSGTFSLSATRKNYELSLAQLSLESDDPSASRLLRKNLYRPEVCSLPGCEQPSGILHRGGPLFEDFGGRAASPALCDEAQHDFDGDVDEIPAYCVVREWLRRERLLHPLAGLTAVVYVRRPIGGVKRAQDFDVYAPGAELVRVSARVEGRAVVLVDGGEKLLNAGCGLGPGADIRRPQVSWDGTKIAFAARSSASEPLAVYEMNADGSACAKHAGINATPPTENGLLIHNFDPTYAPPEGGVSRIVFASTRGNLTRENYDYQGPQRSPADPQKPNANLYSFEPDGRVRQLTYLLNMERQPSFMNDGRLVFVAEKRAPHFYQLALRRLNLDGGDYHPLYAQRGSIGYAEATQVAELADKDFVAIFSERSTPHGGGALGVFNRSIGVDFKSQDASDYPIDPAVLDPAALQSPDPGFFLRSLRWLDPASSARPGEPTSGLYTSPSALPNSLALVSFGAAPDAASFDGDYDLYVVDASTGQKTKLLGQSGASEIEAVGVFERFGRRIFTSALDEPNGHTAVVPERTTAEVHVLDFPVLSSLLFQNTPTGRLIDRDIKRVRVYEDLPPALDTDAFDKDGAHAFSDEFGRVIVRRRQLGEVELERDGSTKITVPGGVPIVFGLPDTPLSRERRLPRWQREQYVFTPGEYVHQSFRERFFDGLCAQCHGSVSGRPLDAALNVDFVTQASVTQSREKAPWPLAKPFAERGAVEGAPADP